MTSSNLILGGGVTGLAAGMTSGAPVFEAAAVGGGICTSYYVAPGANERGFAPPADGEAYRFEIGGGHWVFGGDPDVLRLLDALTPMSQYERSSAVYFPETQRFVPYPLQNNLHALPPQERVAVVAEVATPAGGPAVTMEDWLNAHFGPTLGRVFFKPFHELYTAGLWRTIAPQDAYKTPVDLQAVLRGAFKANDATGYNVRFRYPKSGLDALVRGMASRADVQYDHQAVAIDVNQREVHFANGARVPYEGLISTLPLSTTLRLAGLVVAAPEDPHTSVLVLNIGARRGPSCPDEHWLYVPRSKAGFHRVGFYSNVDAHFLPASRRSTHAGIYVEKAFPGGTAYDAEAAADYANAVVNELQAWGWIDEVEVIDPTWVEVAYTWTWPGSTWQQQAINTLRAHGIIPVGRYAKWHFQGIADSVRDGLLAGSLLRLTP